MGFHTRLIAKDFIPFFSSILLILSKKQNAYETEFQTWACGRPHNLDRSMCCRTLCRWHKCDGRMGESSGDNSHRRHLHHRRPAGLAVCDNNVAQTSQQKLSCLQKLVHWHNTHTVLSACTYSRLETRHPSKGLRFQGFFMSDVKTTNHFKPIYSVIMTQS